ncbi:MAG: Asp-tRNA(Asn)/Glu-tRNA(Gln) amidotransferase subunit GatC [Pseudomonadota bacterium]
MIDTQTITKIAKLAHIEVSDAEKQHFAGELSGILTWIEQLAEVNTDNVPMLTSVSDTVLPWREDKITDGNRRDAILANAPASEYGCFVVPKVIDNE